MVITPASTATRIALVDKVVCFVNEERSGSGSTVPGSFQVAVDLTAVARTKL